MEEDLIRAKAELISGGPIRLPKDYRPLYRYSRSTAGPGAGERGLVFSFHGMRVKKTVSADRGDFEFDPEKRTISKDRIVIVDDVSIIPADFHCPEQAFFNLDRRCRFKCLFCSLPLLNDNTIETVNADLIIRSIKECKNPIRSIALTSGVYGSVSESVERMTDCVSELRKEFPDMPIGVEPYLDNIRQIDDLHDAGVNEIKINIETCTRELFDRFCPGLDYNNIFDILAHSVEVFGKGKVSSNIIVGLGESDDDLYSMIEKLCSMGVTPTIRGLRISELTKGQLAKIGIKEQPSPQRLMTVAKKQKELMERYELDPKSFDTMCLRCTCCDLIPFIDL